MKKDLLYLLLIFTIAACTEKKSSLSSETDEKVAEELQPLPLLDLRDKFKYTDLKSFQIDSFDWETRPGYYQEIDGNTFKLVWQDGKRTFIGQGYDRDYFYSWQKRNPDLIEFVVLTQDERNYCDLLYYCIYDKSGKAIDSFIVAAKCGDGGWAHQTTGRFISEDTYEQVWIDVETEIVDSDSIKYITEGDSVVSHFTIGKNGKVTEKEISKTRIRKVE